MQDSLKTARGIYLTYLGVCAVILLFGLSPQRSGMYESAVRELETLNTLDETALSNYVRDSVTAGLADMDIRNTLESVMDKWGHANIAANIELEPVSIMPFIFESFPKTASLADIERYLLTEHPVFVFKPYAENLEIGLRKSTNAIARTVGMTDANSFTIESIDMNDIQAMDTFNNRLTYSRGQVITEGLDAFVTLSVRWSNYYGVEIEKQQVRGRFVALKPYSFSNWLDSQYELKQLTLDEDGQTNLLPKLRPVWNDIRSSTINGAIVILNRKKSASKKTMTVLGLSAHEDIVVLFAPMATFFMAIFLLSHFRHIHQMANRNAQPLNEFPWIVLFNGFLNQLIVFATIIILPTLANAVIIQRAWDVHSAYTWLGLLLATATLITCVTIVAEIRFLRGRSHSSN